MKLQNLIIGIGLFALFTVIIFGFIDTSGTDCKGIYCENYLNVSHDSNTSKAISNISTVGKKTDTDFQSVRNDVGGFATNRSASVEPDEGNLLAEGVRVLISLPNTWKPVANVLRMSEEQFRIPKEFTQWVIASVIIIIILILIAAVLKNKLQT